VDYGLSNWAAHATHSTLRSTSSHVYSRQSVESYCIYCLVSVQGALRGRPASCLCHTFQILSDTAHVHPMCHMHSASSFPKQRKTSTPPQGTHNVDGFVHSPTSPRAGSSDCELRSSVTSRRELDGEASVLLTEEDKEAAEEALRYILVDEMLPLPLPRVEDTRTEKPREPSLHHSSQRYRSQSRLDCC